MTYAELVEKMNTILAGIEDEDERQYQQAVWNIKINQKWVEERTAKNAMSSDEIREKFVGQFQAFYSEINGKQIRKIYEDEEGFYVKWFGGKMEVEYEPIFKKMKLKYYR